MADEPTTTVPVEDQAPAASTEPTTASEPVEPTSETNGEAPIAKEDEETAGKQATTDVTAPTGEEQTEAAEGPTDPDASGSTPASSKKGNRKSTGGVPEHKKKLNKKKSMPSLNLDCKPGDFYWARLKGYPPWPAVICDEEMLPETLLASRPVSTTRPDGTLRDDFKEGGKNARERTWPVMFMATNEFVWLINTSLTKLDPEECKTHPSKKMTKALTMAYKVASEDHDINYFKGLLKDFEEEQARFDEELKAAQAAEEEKLAKKAEKEAKAIEDAAKSGGDKKKARKSKGGDSDDVEMGDAEQAKPSKKRKKDAESDAEGGKPQKTPKVTKLNAPKTPNGASSSKKASKPKKTVSAPKVDDEETEDKAPMSEEDKLAHKEKTIYYLRHKLQKGFLSRDEAPKDEAMAEMSDFLSQLENHKEIDSAMIKKTKIHKVLKGIVKLATIPKESEYEFKKRSHALLDVWSKRLDAEGGEGAAKESAEPKSVPAEEKPTEEQPAAETNGDTDMKDAAADGEVKEGVEEKDEKKVEEEAVKKADEVDAKAEEKDAEIPEAAAEIAKEAEQKVEEEEKAEKVEEKKDDVEEPPAAPIEKTDPGNDAKDEADGEGDVSMQTAPEEAT